MKPADSMRAQHDMLVQSTILALMATGCGSRPSARPTPRRCAMQRQPPPAQHCCSIAPARIWAAPIPNR